MGSEDSVVIARFTNRAEADLAALRLEAEGVGSVITVDDGGGAIPALDLTGGVRIRVAAENAERALAILEELPED